MFKKIMLATLLIGASATMASASCVKEQVANDHNAWVRSAPRLSGNPLWKLTPGSEVIYCGRHADDNRRDRITWHWVSFKSDQEPWNHEGWMSSRILESANVAVPQSNTPSAPQSTLFDRRATTLPIQKQASRDFRLINNTDYTISKIELSSDGSSGWTTSNVGSVYPSGNIDMVFEYAGPCVVQVRLTFSGAGPFVWLDGFDLCRASTLSVREMSNGKMDIVYN